MDIAVELLTPLMFHFFLRSASLCSFFLPNYFIPGNVAIAQSHMDILSALVKDGKLDVPLDTKDGQLKGIESVAAAVDWLHSGKSVGKVVIKL